MSGKQAERTVFCGAAASMIMEQNEFDFHCCYYQEVHSCLSIPFHNLFSIWNVCDWF